MKYVKKTASIFTRYDIHIEVAHQARRRISDDDMLQQVADSLVTGQDKEIKQIISQALVERDPMTVITQGLLPGMKEVSRLWDKGNYFLPQVILSSDAMITGIALCEKKMGKSMKKKARVITHTAAGDIHDIGQVIVNALLNASGFEVINLGADVPVDEVIQACKMYRPVMLTGTALMTTTMSAFPQIATKLKKLGLMIPFVCGGGAVNEEFVTSFDLGIWGREAGQAPGMAEDALNKLTWQDMRGKWNG